MEGAAARPFGSTEGIAVYLNGTDLPDTTYQECDSNFVYSESNTTFGATGARPILSPTTGLRSLVSYWGRSR